MANVTIHNKTPRLVAIALLDAKGTPVERKLQPHEQTEPLSEATVGAYTRGLAKAGTVRIRSA